MSAEKSLSYDDIKRVIGVPHEQIRKVFWHNKEIHILKTLSFKQYIMTIQSILRDCKNNDGLIIPELVDFAIRANIVAAYALIEQPEVIDDLYYLVYSSDLYDFIYKNVNQRQVDAIFDAIKVYTS